MSSLWQLNLLKKQLLRISAIKINVNLIIISLKESQYSFSQINFYEVNILDQYKNTYAQSTVFSRASSNFISVFLRSQQSLIFFLQRGFRQFGNSGFIYVSEADLNMKMYLIRSCQCNHCKYLDYHPMHAYQIVCKSKDLNHNIFNNTQIYRSYTLENPITKDLSYECLCKFCLSIYTDLSHKKQIVVQNVN
ncbi:unnamed protein product [Paramecium primaurelia]|uniref:Uncharacterized protein n=1 Tax=Paramecium primaurelia TaxID=5886 RepID=A0A8S1NRC3_PARPR|nr:unnamed protein product [Paramecium primaurelia]